MFAAFSGTPFTVTGERHRVEYAEQHADGRSRRHREDARRGWSKPAVFRHDAWAQPTGVRFGTTGRNQFYGPGGWSLDLSMFRAIALGGTKRSSSEWKDRTSSTTRCSGILMGRDERHVHADLEHSRRRGRERRAGQCRLHGAKFQVGHSLQLLVADSVSPAAAMPRRGCVTLVRIRSQGESQPLRFPAFPQPACHLRIVSRARGCFRSNGRRPSRTSHSTRIRQQPARPSRASTKRRQRDRRMLPQCVRSRRCYTRGNNGTHHTKRMPGVRPSHRATSSVSTSMRSCFSAWRRHADAATRLRQALTVTPDYLPARVTLAEALFEASQRMRAAVCSSLSSASREPSRPPSSGSAGSTRPQAFTNGRSRTSSARSRCFRVGRRLLRAGALVSCVGRTRTRSGLARHAQYGARWPAARGPGARRGHCAEGRRARDPAAWHCARRGGRCGGCHRRARSGARARSVARAGAREPRSRCTVAPATRRRPRSTIARSLRSACRSRRGALRLRRPARPAGEMGLAADAYRKAIARQPAARAGPQQPRPDPRTQRKLRAPPMNTGARSTRSRPFGWRGSISGGC